MPGKIEAPRLCKEGTYRPFCTACNLHTVPYKADGRFHKVPSSFDLPFLSQSDQFYHIVLFPCFPKTRRVTQSTGGLLLDLIPFKQKGQETHSGRRPYGIKASLVWGTSDILLSVRGIQPPGAYFEVFGFFIERYSAEESHDCRTRQ